MLLGPGATEGSNPAAGTGGAGMYATPTMNLGAGPVVIAAPRSFGAGSGKRRRSDAPQNSYPRPAVPVAAAAPLAAGMGLQPGSAQQMGMHIDPPPSKRVRTRAR